MGIQQVEMPQSSKFLLRFGCFSLITSPCVVASLWLISRVLQKSILTIFVSVLIAFHSGMLLLITFVLFIYFVREISACMHLSEGQRERERERERIPSGLCAVSTEPNAGLDPLNREIMT